MKSDKRSLRPQQRESEGGIWGARNILGGGATKDKDLAFCRLAGPQQGVGAAMAAFFSFCGSLTLHGKERQVRGGWPGERLLNRHCEMRAMVSGQQEGADRVGERPRCGITWLPLLPWTRLGSQQDWGPWGLPHCVWHEISHSKLFLNLKWNPCTPAAQPGLFLAF